MNKIVLVASHLVVFILCLFLGKSLLKPSAEETDTIANVKSGKPLSSHAAPSSQELLSSFLPQAPPKRDSYKEFIERVNPATDFASQLANLLDQIEFEQGVGKATNFFESTPEEAELLNRIHAHVHLWLQTDPEAFLLYLQENPKATYILKKGPTNAILDHIAETGISNNLNLIFAMDRLDKESNSNPFPYFFLKAMQEEFKNGASLSLLDQFESEITQFTRHKDGFLDRVAPYISFSEKDAFLDKLLSNGGDNSYYISKFLSNKGHPQEEVVPWIQGMLASEQLGEKFKKSLGPQFGYWLQREASQLQPNERVELSVAQLGGNPKKIARTVAEVEMATFLNKGPLDYAYQFRHGKLSAQEIGEIFEEQYPDLYEQNPVDSIRHLYQELAEEDPEAAIPVLDLLNDPAKAANMRYYSLMGSFYKISPDQLYAQTQTLPPPAGPGQEKVRFDAWKFHTASLLSQHGDDYVQWVTEMPPGPDKEAAIARVNEHALKLFPSQAEAIATQLNASQNE